MNEQKRLFFGISLPEDCQQEIVRWRADTFPAEAGKPVTAANLHITLAFLGDVSAEKMRVLAKQASRIQQPAFTVTLDDAGHWPRSGVVWLGPKSAPRGLLQLAELLRAQAARSGCYQSPMPFHPHVTLLRNATQPVSLPPRNFRWQSLITRFALFQSCYKQGRTKYESLMDWPLTQEK